MKKVTGIGGIFFKCKDPAAIRRWYEEKLGLNTDEYGTSIIWRKEDKPNENGFTVWSPFPQDTDYFSPSPSNFMVNFRVDDLQGILKELKKQGVTTVGEIQEFDYGLFAHILDPEGNKIELWEPNDKEFRKILKKMTPE